MWVKFRGINIKMEVLTLITVFSRVKEVFRLVHVTLFELSIYTIQTILVKVSFV